MALKNNSFQILLANSYLLGTITYESVHCILSGQSKQRGRLQAKFVACIIKHRSQIILTKKFPMIFEK